MTPGTNATGTVPAGYVQTSGGLIAPAELVKRSGTLREDSPRRIRMSFEGSEDNRWTESWLHPKTNPIELITRFQSKLRDRARDLARNAPWFPSLKITWKNMVIGRGFKLLAKPGEDELCECVDEELRKRAELLWKRWQRGVDVDRRKSLAMFHRTAEDEYIEVGEYFIWRKVAKDAWPLPLVLELLPSERLDPTLSRPRSTSMFTGKTVNRISNGIEFDRDGRRVAYHFDSVDDWGNSNPMGEKVRVPADRVSHRYLQIRAGQERGIPPIYASMLLLRDVDNGIEYELDAWQSQSRFVGSLHHKNAGLFPDSQERDAIDNRPIHRVAGATLLDLDTDEDLKLPQPTRPNDKLEPFVAFAARTFGKSVGFSYEATTGDYSKVNFASGRLGSLSDRATVRWHQDEIHHIDLRSTYNDFVFLAIQLNKFGDVDIIDFVMDPERYTEHEFIFNGFEHHDPGKEVVAAGLRVLLGLSTRAKECAALGLDWEEIAEQLKRETDLYEELGIPIVTVGGSQLATGRGNSGFEDSDAKDKRPADGANDDDDTDENEDEEEARRRGAPRVEIDMNLATQLALAGGEARV